MKLINTFGLGNISVFNLKQKYRDFPETIKEAYNDVGWHGIKANTDTKMPIEFFDNEEIDFSDIAFDYKKDINNNMLFSDLTFEDIKKITKKNKNYVPKQRISVGYKHGFIDAKTFALLKQENGWIDDNDLTILPISASEDEIFDYIKSKTNVIESFTLEQLNECEEKGVIKVDDKIIATKIPDGDWKGYWENNKGRKFLPGEAVRVLAHSDEDYVIYGAIQESRMFHGNVTNSPKEEKEHVTRAGASKQGDGVYATASVNEAVRVYANPKSFEVSGKLLVDDEKGRLNKKDYVLGHLYEVKSTLPLFKATLGREILNQDEIPSISAISLLAKSCNCNMKYAFNQWLKMKNGYSSYDVYESVNAINEMIIQKNMTSKNFFNKIFAGMGFEGVEITIPSKSKIHEMERKLKELKEYDESYFKEEKINKNLILNSANSYLTGVKNSIPAKAMDAHLIVFDKNLIQKEHIKLLPINNGTYEMPDLLYSLDEKPLNLEDVMKQKSPGFDDLKKIWSQAKDLDSRIMSY